MIVKIGLTALVIVLLAVIMVVWAIMTAVDEEELNQGGDRYWSDEND